MHINAIFSIVTYPYGNLNPSTNFSAVMPIQTSEYHIEGRFGTRSYTNSHY